MTDLKAIEALRMCRELMLFDPMTGEDILLDQLNQDNRDLYDACEAGISALQERIDREEGCKK